MSFLRLQPDLDKPADGFGAAGEVILLAAEIVYVLQCISSHTNRDGFALDWRATTF